MLLFFVSISACTTQVETQVLPLATAPDTGARETIKAPTPLSTVLPSATPSVIPSPVEHYLVSPLSNILPPGQYLGIVEDCDSSQPKPPCRIRVISKDNSTDELLAVNLPGGSFLYNNNRIVDSSLYWVDDQELSKIQIFDLEKEEITEVPTPETQNCVAEAWSPNGMDLILLCASRDDYRRPDIVLLSLSEGKTTLLLHDNNENQDSGGYEQVRWSPDGKWLAFYQLSSRGPQLVKNLYLMDMDCAIEPSTCAAKTKTVPVKELVGKYGDRLISWTPESNLARAINNQIEIYNPKSGKKIQTLPVNLAGALESGYHSMTWSPDGEWIAIQKWNVPGIFLIPTSGGNPVHINAAGNDLLWLVASQ
jgi:WD40 repeat protein